MSIVKMKHLELIALRADREELLRQLQHLGCVEVSQPAPNGEETIQNGLTPADAEAVARGRERETVLEAALATLKKYAPEKGGLLSPLPQVTDKALFDEEAYSAALAAAEKLAQGERDLAAIRSEIAKGREQQTALEPWKDIDLPLDTVSTRSVEVIFGSVGASTPWETMTAEVQEAAGLVELTRAGKSKDQQYLLLMCHKSALDEAMGVLKGYGFARAGLRGWTGTAAENLRRIDGELTALEAREAEVSKAMTEQGGQQFALRLALDRTRQELQRESAKEKLLDTDSTFLLEGWFPAEDEDKVVKLLEGHTAYWELSDPTEEEYSEVPIRLKNGWLTRCMNTITEMYALPTYDGVDPNPLMFPFFVVFFGMMMADMAYGIVMILGTQIYLRKVKPKESMRNFMELFFWCGISTFIWGAMTGGFLGDFIPQLLRLIDPSSTFEMPALFTPLSDTIAILVGSLILGAIQVVTGMAISVVRKFQTGDVLDALFDEITWWIILTGTGLAVAGIGVGKFILIAGALMLTVGGTRNAKGFGKVTSLIGLVYNGVSGFFSDILSYLRLMALMLAGSVISQVFNTLGSVFGSVIGFVIISLIGNVLNLALNLLGCYVHDLRLQCLEYFNRFYKSGGKPFKPLTIDTQYVNVLKEEI